MQMEEDQEHAIAEATFLEHHRIDDWFNTKSNIVFYQSEMEEAFEKVYQHKDNDVDNSVNADGIDMLNHVAAVLGFEKDKFGVVCQLSENRILARTFTPKGGFLHFIVLDPKATDFIALQFSWNILYFYSNFGYGRPGGCCPPSPESILFWCWKSQDQNHVMLLGPAERPLDPIGRTAMPAAKMFDCKQLTVQDYCININKPGINSDRDEESEDSSQQGWPAAVAFDPRPGHENEVTLICSTQHCFQISGWWRAGVLMRCHLEKHETMATYKSVSMSGSTLQYLLDGHQVACLQPEVQDSPDYYARKTQKIWVFTTDNLAPLYTVPLNLESMRPNIESLLMLHSVDTAHLAIFSWMVRVKVGTNSKIDKNAIREVLGKVRVYSSPLTRKLFPLRKCCDIVILTACRGRSLDSLPLPGALITALKGPPFLISKT